ncbi:hypothetical protein [Halothiobacillus neapolitanus]|uniref:Uncharacterized protein n=1 Tax=Halothiobacillus neapolitanus (strain ATCC 23641 / DSM 15147 / CIP 104769 / NCIMB 8539 / c2) TaxID=555778 RepID=D0KX05_HALNC|nr:hypothetical protein [Halothiobacillus neapolitanus]ACX97125.1 hypothetical protein Hneap_2315 [Halothiobacillus neapolitanus c2]TDN60259.1 hypothetical protein C8D83_10414 [Halothiobacillus neapolitanus]
MNKYTKSNLFLSTIKTAGMFFLFAASGLGVVSADNQRPAGNELHYTGVLTGTATFNAINCTLRSGHLVGLGYFSAIGKSDGPNIALFSVNDDGTQQRLGFVPSGKSQQDFYFSAKASGTIPGLDASTVSNTKTITFTHVLLRKRGSNNDELTLDGRLTCTTATE